jgi:hypothetical protein
VICEKITYGADLLYSTRFGSRSTITSCSLADDPGLARCPMAVSTSMIVNCGQRDRPGWWNA